MESREHKIIREFKEQVEMADFRDEEGHSIKMNITYKNLINMMEEM